MPIRYEVTRAPDMVLVTASGHVTLAECERAATAIARDPAVGPTASLLVDASAVIDTPTMAQLPALAGAAAALEAAGVRRIAIVAPQDFVFGVARAFAVYAEPIGTEVAVVRDLRSAEAWLRTRPRSEPPDASMSDQSAEV